jgi:hypothetical protein
MVMQNLDVIQGRPTWNSKYVISALNSCGRFSPLQFEYEDRGQKTIKYTKYEGYGANRTRKEESITVHDRSCVAYATNRDGKLIKGPMVSIEMAVKEGWYTKSDSKWPHMPELMLSYRAAKFFGNLYAPDVLMGMHSSDEILDVQHEVTDFNSAKHKVETPSPITTLNMSVQNQPKGEDVSEAVVVSVETPTKEAPQSDDEELV